jgi:hypothetical protein
MLSTCSLPGALVDGHVHASGLKLTGILSATIFRDEFMGAIPGATLSGTFHQLWTDFADALAAAPSPPEIAMVLSTSRGTAECEFSILVLGRGADHVEAERACREFHGSVRLLAETILGFARFRDLERAELEKLFMTFQRPVVTELKRRREALGMLGGPGQSRVGFLFAEGSASEPVSGMATHLFPWVPSDDPWMRLTQVLREDDAAHSMVVHIRGYGIAPPEALAEAHDQMRAIEAAEQVVLAASGQRFVTDQLAALRQLGGLRLAALYHRVLAVRVFLVGNAAPSAALLATVAGSIDDPSAYTGAAHGESLFRGGLKLEGRSTRDVLAPLSPAPSDILFSAGEVTAVLRTPMPTNLEIPGICLLEARTIPLGGRSGDDVAIGDNAHRAHREAVRFDDELRFRHTYVVGQTGTGKSTLLLNMLLEDAARGRGICLIDPHGSLVEDVLQRLPAERWNDVVLLDVADFEHPVGFNPLCIQEELPERYVLARDLTIDGLLSYLLKTYSEVPEGFGPMFENHFRAMLSLLLGAERPSDTAVPNLLLVRTAYANSLLRRALMERMDGKDIGLQDMLAEATRVTGDGAWENMAPYITSKLSRFVADTTLRNVLCQRSTLDFRAIVADSKILLVHLARGRVGDLPAGLLASQVVSGIWRAVVARGDSKDLPGFYLFADEFQIFADSRFSELLAEARKFRLSLTLAHQHVEQLPPSVRSAVLGNCGTIVSFRVGLADSQALSSAFFPYLSPYDLLGLPNHHAYVRGSGVLGQRPFSIETFQPPGVVENAASTRIREASRARHGRPRLEVEKEISETFAIYEAMRPAKRRQSESVNEV